MTDKELLRAITGFRMGILDKRKSTMMCHVICWPLQAFLSILRLETTLTEGEVALGGHNRGLTIGHYWLTLKDGRIIDPTADQFNKMGRKDMPAVYFGKKPRWYRKTK